MNVPEIGLVYDTMGGYHLVVRKGDGVKSTGKVNKETYDIPPVKEAKDIIAERTKGLDLKEHPTTTKQEYADYIWNKKFAKRRDKGVKEFWYQEQQRLLNNEPLTRD